MANRSEGGLKGKSIGMCITSANRPPAYGESGGPWIVTCHVCTSDSEMLAKGRGSVSVRPWYSYESE